MKTGILDSFLATPRPYEAIVSPDLKLVVWAWANIGPNVDVYITSLDKSTDPKKLTNFHQDTSVVSWTEDSQHIVVSHDYDGDERYRLYKVNVYSGIITPLTGEHPQYFIRGGQITANNKYLVYGANYDFAAKKEIEPTVIYRQDLETGDVVKLAAPQKPNYLCPQLNKLGTHIIYSNSDRHPNGSQVWLVDIDGKQNKEILNFGDKVRVSASWHSNSEDIVFITEADKYRKVGIFNIISGATRWLIDDPMRNIEDMYILRGSAQLVVEQVENAQSNSTILDVQTLKESRPSKLNSIIPIAQLGPGIWLSRYYNSKQPTDLIIHDSSKVIRSITDVFAKVDYKQVDLVKAENYTWKSIDGLEIQGWLYRAAGMAIGTIVFVHGGPTSHSEDRWSMSVQYFTSQGFNVLDPNYRGSTGFGLQYQESIKEDGWGGKEQDDILEGIKSLVREGIAVPGKIGITGTSYGGFSSWFAITHFPTEYVAAAIPICGMTDLVVDYETTRPDLRGLSEGMMGGKPSDVPDRYYNGSPINFIKNIKGKLLIVQGAKDPNVSLENVRIVEEALQKEGVKYEKLVFDDEGHGISKPENQKTLLLESVKFFKGAFGA